ncbi:ovarian cancer G-protein coupled receptor 1-like [Amia ocellicauda]|uniref:ovarian cancer G-protein coupled receptor 1-like n=1 Tax=Amia ocellicauda TaxID=2972642 RepID=UPI0034646866
MDTSGSSEEHVYGSDNYNGISDNNQSYDLTSIFPAVFYIIVFCLGLPANCWALYRLYCLFQSGSRVYVYIINMLLADLLQLAALPTLIHVLLNYVYFESANTGNLILLFVSQAAIAGFLVLVSLERYLAIAWPAWYHRIQRLRCALPIALGVWGLCTFILLIFELYISVYYYTHAEEYILSIAIILFVLPLILLVFSCVGTRRALARADSVPDTERRRAVWTVALALLIFTVVYSPYVLTLLIFITSEFAGNHLHSVLPVLAVTCSLLSLSAVLPPLLCLFLRESPRDTGDRGAEQGDAGEQELHPVSENTHGT